MEIFLITNKAIFSFIQTPLFIICISLLIGAMATFVYQKMEVKIPFWKKQMTAFSLAALYALTGSVGTFLVINATILFAKLTALTFRSGEGFGYFLQKNLTSPDMWKSTFIYSIPASIIGLFLFVNFIIYKKKNLVDLFKYDSVIVSLGTIIGFCFVFIMGVMESVVLGDNPAFTLLRVLTYIFLVIAAIVVLNSDHKSPVKE